MKNKIYLLLLLLFFVGVVGMNAQNSHFYYYKNQKITLNLDRKFLNISTSENFDKSALDGFKFKEITFQEDNSTGENRKFAKLEFRSELSSADFEKVQNDLRKIKGIKNVSLFFKRPKATPIGTSTIFYVKLKDERGFEALKKTAEENQARIVESFQGMPLWYVVTLTPENESNSVAVANKFYETGQFADIDPAFMFNFRPVCTNDTNFGSLWGLNNSANPNIDINACQAWTLSQGSGVNVAILDQGISKTHNDLAANISPLSFDAQSCSGTSVFIAGNNHGTHVAGTVGAVKDNNLHVVGVAPQSKLISVSHSLNVVPNISAQLACGINWAVANGADVINNSWGDQGGALYGQLYSPALESAILNAMTNGRGGKGTLIVFAAGNYGGGGAIMDYPGTFNDNILTVGSITASGSRSSFSGYGTKLDVVAPGSNILSTVATNTTASMNGTSMAAPHVTGLVALILSANPCLTGQQVRDIIESTSQKIPGYVYSATAGRSNGTWNNQLGYGLIDAYAAVQRAQQMYSATLDLYVKDTPGDLGIEPNTISPYMWGSEDIWVRNYNDNGLVHQNPDYSPTNPNYVYVRVRNKSCVASTGNERLKLYWAKAGTSLAWPLSWNGTYFIGGVLMGKQIGAVAGLPIPVLQPGEEAIVPFAWNVPNPADYVPINSEPWHFCLLTRIEAANDPMTFPETADLNGNVKNNNNIAWKNVTVVDILANGTLGGVVGVGNPVKVPKKYNLEFIAEDIPDVRPIFEQAQVGVKMDERLYRAWQQGGGVTRGLVEGRERMAYLVRTNNATLNNIVFEPLELGTLNLTFTFTNDDPTPQQFIYHIVQKDAETGAVVGGETYVVNKGETRGRRLFANAGDDKKADKDEMVTLSAAQLNEAVVYNWYDSEGKLIYQGKDLTVAVDVAKKYKLEVVALADGLKDYAEVAVTLNPSSLGGIAPNPAKDNVTVSYKLNDTGSAYLSIIGSYGANKASNNYILDVKSSEATIDISNYPSGLYTVALISNGKIVDAKKLVKK